MMYFRKNRSICSAPIVDNRLIDQHQYIINSIKYNNIENIAQIGRETVETTLLKKGTGQYLQCKRISANLNPKTRRSRRLQESNNTSQCTRTTHSIVIP